MMFVSHNMNVHKKKIQKPNILRRQPNASKKTSIIHPTNKSGLSESQDVGVTITFEQSNKLLQDEKLIHCVHKKPICSEEKPIQEMKTDSVVSKVKLASTPEEEVNVSAKNSLVYVDTTCIYNSEDGKNQSLELETLIDDMLLQAQDAAAPPGRRTPVERPKPSEPRRGARAASCPARACGRAFGSRDELARHLGEEHGADDAPHGCAECGRRFFWASGLRAHARAHAGGRGPLACPWPGCGRAFRQPCRLREHARAHTGDRPYACRHPGCGWAFRTASKLGRHARRHTGERRHACAACGCAFLRREHLREHALRHEPRARARACPRAGCERRFANASSLYAHVKRAHAEAAEGAPNCAVEVEQVRADAGEWRCARTHCTWPLARSPEVSRALRCRPPGTQEAQDARGASLCALLLGAEELS